MGNRIFGEYLRRYWSGEGMSLGAKILTISMLWIGLGASAFLVMPKTLVWVRLMLLAIGLGVTFHIARIPTKK
jgi:uncharacterized membrane protein YbaN (DUF454 family)